MRPERVLLACKRRRPAGAWQGCISPRLSTRRLAGPYALQAASQGGLPAHMFVSR